MLLTTALVLLFCGVVSGQSALQVDTETTDKVVVPRCCPHGLALSPEVEHGDKLPADVPALCTTVFDERFWLPELYRPYGTMSIFVSHDYWQLEYSQVPKCAKLRAKPKWGPDSMGLLLDGGLQLETNKFPLPAKRFCADADVNLVCQPDVFKCCPPGDMVESAQCVPHSHYYKYNWDPILFQFHELLNSEDGTAGVGMPTCAEGFKLGMVGDLADASYKTDGVIQLGSTRLGRDEWCVGKIRNSNDVSVFACMPQDFYQEKEEARKKEKQATKIVPIKLLVSDNRDLELPINKEREPWIERNILWVIIGLVWELLMCVLVVCVFCGYWSCRRVHKRREHESLPQISRTISNQNEYV